MPGQNIGRIASDSWDIRRVPYGFFRVTRHATGASWRLQAINVDDVVCFLVAGLAQANAADCP